MEERLPPMSTPWLKASCLGDDADRAQPRKQNEFADDVSHDADTTGAALVPSEPAPIDGASTPLSLCRGRILTTA